MFVLSTSLPPSSLPAGRRLSVSLSRCFWLVAAADRCHGSLFVFERASTLDRCEGRVSVLRMFVVEVRRSLCWLTKGATMESRRNRCDWSAVVSSARMHRQWQARQLSMRRRWGFDVGYRRCRKSYKPRSEPSLARADDSRHAPEAKLQCADRLQHRLSVYHTRPTVATRFLDSSTPSQAARKNIAP